MFQVTIVQTIFFICRLPLYKVCQLVNLLDCYTLACIISVISMSIRVNDIPFLQRCVTLVVSRTYQALLACAPNSKYFLITENPQSERLWL